jgi:hypothetical protein
VFTDAPSRWPAKHGENAFNLQSHPELIKAIDHCVASGAHLIIPSLGDYSWCPRRVHRAQKRNRD